MECYNSPEIPPEVDPYALPFFSTHRAELQVEQWERACEHIGARMIGLGAPGEAERPRSGDPDEAFEDRYLDILQNIESAIMQVYREHPELTDWDVLSAIEALLRSYQAESKGRQPAPLRTSELATEVLEAVRQVCEWQLGRQPLVPTEDTGPPSVSPEPITLDELIDCLKRIRKSINLWTKEGGPQGYLTYVSQFAP